MRVAVLSYPMLFQRDGGLQVQVRETVAALREIGIDARLFDINAERLADYDIVHIFSAINGVWRIAEAAKSESKPVVLSSVLNGSQKKGARFRAKMASWLTAHITAWEYATGYDQVRRALQLADRIIALGKAEADFIRRHFDQRPEKISVIPNGIARRFFTADPVPFLDKTGLHPGYVLCVASISPYKNQLGVVRAAKGLNVPIVLVGPCAAEHEGYLAACLDEARDQVQYIGPLPYDAPLLASAYAAAGATVLLSNGEVMPLTILESLAAGTPAVVTRHQSLDLEPHPPIYAEVDPENTAQVRRALSEALEAKPNADCCRSMVKNLDWSHVAHNIAFAYRELL